MLGISTQYSHHETSKIRPIRRLCYHCSPGWYTDPKQRNGSQTATADPRIDLFFKRSFSLIDTPQLLEDEWQSTAVQTVINSSVLQQNRVTSDSAKAIGASNIPTYDYSMMASSYDRSSTWSSTSPYSGSSPSYASSTSSGQTNYYGQVPANMRSQQQNLPSLTALSLPGQRPGYYTTGQTQIGYGPRSEYTSYVCPSNSNTDVFNSSVNVRSANTHYNPSYHGLSRSPYISSPYEVSPVQDHFSPCYPSNQSWTSNMTNPYGGGGYMSNDSTNISIHRRRGNLPKQITEVLRGWFHDHIDHPYPTDEDKQMFIQRTGLTISQVGRILLRTNERTNKYTDTLHRSVIGSSMPVGDNGRH